MRVGNETRAWKKSEIVFFDDSFEHEVWNRCRSERVVLQLVFVHPDLMAQQQEADVDSKDNIVQRVFGLAATH
jgi:hypothetical protein